MSESAGTSGGVAPVLVLASASPARLATLRAAGIDPVVRVSAVDEDAVVARYGVAAPEDVALVLARAKAEDVAAGCPARASRLRALVVGCDSVLELDGEVHGKPADAQVARERWRRMRGRSGVLHTGHWLIDMRDVRDSQSVGSGATLGARVVDDGALRPARRTPRSTPTWRPANHWPSRVRSRSTGWAGPTSRGIEGDHHGVVGLSLPLLRDLLGEAGVTWHNLGARLPTRRPHPVTTVLALVAGTAAVACAAAAVARRTSRPALAGWALLARHCCCSGPPCGTWVRTCSPCRSRLCCPRGWEFCCCTAAPPDGCRSNAGTPPSCCSDRPRRRARCSPAPRPGPACPPRWLAAPACLRWPRGPRGSAVPAARVVGRGGRPGGRRPPGLPVQASAPSSRGRVRTVARALP